MRGTWCVVRGTAVRGAWCVVRGISRGITKKPAESSQCPTQQTFQFSRNRRLEITELRDRTHQALGLRCRTERSPEMPATLRLRGKCVSLNDIGFNGSDCASQLVKDRPVFRSIEIFGGSMH